MSMVIVAGKGYQGLLSKPPFGYAKQLNSPIPRSNKQKDTVYEYPSSENCSWEEDGGVKNVNGDCGQEGNIHPGLHEPNRQEGFPPLM